MGMFTRFILNVSAIWAVPKCTIGAWHGKLPSDSEHQIPRRASWAATRWQTSAEEKRHGE